MLSLVAMTNTLMFSFISAVSYDNLTNLLAAMSIYYLLIFFKKRSGNLLVLSVICQLTGSLTKTTFLILVMNSLLLVHEFRKIRYLPKALPIWFRLALNGACLTLVALLALALNIQLYGVNDLHHQNISPEMYEVLPHEIVIRRDELRCCLSLPAESFQKPSYPDRYCTGSLFSFSCLRLSIFSASCDSSMAHLAVEIA